MVKGQHQITKSGPSSVSVIVKLAMLSDCRTLISDDVFMSEYEFFSLVAFLEASLLQSRCLFPWPLYLGGVTSVHINLCLEDVQ